MVVSGVEIFQPYGMADYQNMLLNDAFGNYRQLLADVTLSPVMGHYLDMANNDKPNPTTGINPNENYGREVLQLFSVGLVELNLDGSATGFWIDMPTYTCPIHTDGELPGAIQMYWIGASQDLGTTWYYYKDQHSVRHSFKFEPNTGYIMINNPDPDGYRKLQWHGMLTPVPDNSFRVSSYSWLVNK
jgi:hypothetical protein